MTAQTLISAALRLIGALAQSETPPAGDLQNGLEILNGMVDAWRAHRLMIFANSRNVYTLTAGQQDYTIGPSGGTFTVTVRPIYLTNASVIVASGASSVEIPIDLWTDEDWAQQRVKTVQSTLPTAVYYNETFPLGTFSFWPIPSGAVQVALYWPEPMAQFADLATDYDLAPGYPEAIKYNLAVRLCPEFGRTLDQVVLGLAGESMGVVKRANKTLYDMRVDPALVGGVTGRGTYNYLIDK